MAQGLIQTRVFCCFQHLRQRRQRQDHKTCGRQRKDLLCHALARPASWHHVFFLYSITMAVHSHQHPFTAAHIPPAASPDVAGVPGGCLSLAQRGDGSRICAMPTTGIVPSYISPSHGRSRMHACKPTVCTLFARPSCQMFQRKNQRWLRKWRWCTVAPASGTRAPVCRPAPWSTAFAHPRR